jgi:hypothetical protein
MARSRKWAHTYLYYLAIILVLSLLEIPLTLESLHESLLESAF